MRFTLWLALLWLCGCSPGHMFANAARPAPRAETSAGVERVDITPPPGLSLWGHGPESRIATGRMTRLWCQVFVIVGAAPTGVRGDGVALVTCDMAWSSLIVQRQIAKRVAFLSEELAMATPFGANRIWLMATHTHAGMGHLWPWENYTGPLSSRLRGFDMDAVNFIAGKVGDAIVKAYRERVPARVAWGKSQAYGIGYNRSLAAFDHNPRRPASLPDHERDPVTQRILSPAERATDPQLALLRIDRASGEPMGALAVFGVHPAVVGNDSELYHGDLFGFAVDHARQQLGHIVVGIANGIEGDVAPQKQLAAPRESRRLGEALGDHIVSLWRDLEDDAHAPEAGRATVTAGYRDLRLPGAPTHDGPLCAVPMLGAAAGGGAEDNPTTLRLIMHNNPGVKRRPVAGEPTPCHGPKLAVQAPVFHFEAGRHFPEYVPIGVARIGDGIVATVPGEVTTVTGVRIREAIVAALPDPPSVVAIAGLTGGYIQYVASRDEYPLQLYEGASTLYGPATAALLAEQHGCLASQILGDGHLGCGDHHEPIDVPKAIPFPSGEAELLRCAGKDDRKEAHCSALPAPVLKAIDPIVRAVLTTDGELAYEYRWDMDALPQGTVDNRRPVSACVQRFTTRGWQRVDDDHGTRITVRALPRDYDRWAATWRPKMPRRDARGRPIFAAGEAEGLGCREVHRIVIKGEDPRGNDRAPCDVVPDCDGPGQICSDGFTLECSRDLATLDALEGQSMENP